MIEPSILRTCSAAISLPRERADGRADAAVVLPDEARVAERRVAAAAQVEVAAEDAARVERAVGVDARSRACRRRPKRASAVVSV